MNDVDLLDRLIRDTEKYPTWSVVRKAFSERRRIHLAVMVEPFLSWIIEGRKTIESRFSKNSIAPFRQIDEGDLVLLKVTGGPVVACFTAARIEFVTLAPEELSRIQTDYSEAICADEEFWRLREGKRYATLIGVNHVKELRPAPVLKSDRRGWIAMQPSSVGPRTEQLTLV